MQCADEMPAACFLLSEERRKTLWPLPGGRQRGQDNLIDCSDRARTDFNGQNSEKKIRSLFIFSVHRMVAEHFLYEKGTQSMWLSFKTEFILKKRNRAAPGYNPNKFYFCTGLALSLFYIVIDLLHLFEWSLF